MARRSPSVLDVAHRILEEAGEPLHYQEIARRMIEQGLWSTKGKTPDATVNARIAVDVKTHRAESRFQRTGGGIFALREWGLPEYTPASSTRHRDD